MVLVKITAGTYGYNNGVCVAPKDKNSDPFMVSEAEANRLVNMKVAEIVNKTDVLPKDSIGGLDESDAFTEEADLNAMTNKKLKEMADNMGLDTSKMRVKKDFIDAITKALEESPLQAAGEDMPDIGAEEPIV